MPDIPAEALTPEVLHQVSLAVDAAFVEEFGYGWNAEFEESVARAAAEALAPFIAEHIAREIERVVVSGEFARPRYERGGFLNDARWAARVAREAFTAGERPDGTAPKSGPGSPQGDATRLSGLPHPPGRSEALTDAHSAPEGSDHG